MLVNSVDPRIESEGGFTFLIKHALGAVKSCCEKRVHILYGVNHHFEPIKFYAH